jgi:hypothetical protein
MPCAATIRRGAFLKVRLAVNGMNHGSRSFTFAWANDAAVGNDVSLAMDRFLWANQVIVRAS